MVSAYLAAAHLRPSTLPTLDITAVRHRPTQPTQPFIYWYNLHYGNKSKKCLEGCQYN